MSEFFHMGGYAAYVWSAFGIFAIVLLIDALTPLLKRRRVLRELRGRLRREQNRREEPSA
jgi:heme exporter protein D